MREKKQLTDPRVQATLDRRRSGASGKHGDRRLKRLRTRSAIKSSAIKEG